MQREQWFENQPVLKADLDRAQSSKEEAIKSRLLDVFAPGVLKDSQLAGESDSFVISQGPSAGLFVTVGTGVAFSPLGERIIISSLVTYNAANPSTLTDNGIGGMTATPLSTGSQNIPVSDNITNYIWVGYLQAVDTTVFTLAEFTNQRLFTKSDDGYSIVVTTTSLNPDTSRYVLLGEVVTVSGAVSSININNTLDAQVLTTTVPAVGPFQVNLPVLANKPSQMEAPSGIPVIAGFTYTTATTPAAGQFAVDFINSRLLFNATNGSASITVNYSTPHTRRQYSLTSAGRVGAQVSSYLKPSSYVVGDVVSFDDHVNAKGTGTVSPANPHALSANDLGLTGILNLGAELASQGLILPNGDASVTTSALFPSAVSAFVLNANEVTIAPLIATQSLNCFGTFITSTDIPSLQTFNFEDPNNPGFPRPVGTYVFYVDPSTRNVAIAQASTAPVGTYPIASIVWDGSNLQLPITDLRVFGTTADANLRLETSLGLSEGLATNNRTASMYHATLTGTVAVTAPNYAFTGLANQTLSVTVDGTPYTVTFPVSPTNIPITAAVSAINAQIGAPGFLAVATPTNRIKLLAAVSLLITGGTGLAILGFTVSETDSGTLREIRVSGADASVGSQSAQILLTYDISGNVTQVAAVAGNRILTTNITYNADSTIKSVTESVV